MAEKTIESGITIRAVGGSALQHRIGVFFRHFVLALWCGLSLFPVVWVVLNAFKDNRQIFGNPFGLPSPAVLKNFPQAFVGVHLGTTLTNSLFYAAVTVTLTLLLASMCSFYLAKISRGSLLYVYFILGIMIPVQAIMIPIFVSMRNFGLLNTRSGIILVYIVTSLSLSIFILTAFMRKGVPNELLEAAVIDGCGPLNVFFRIALPISRAGLATVGTFVFLGVWNEFLFALLMLSKPDLRTLNLSVYMLRNQYSADHGLMAAGIVILITPAILMYVIFQKQVVKGLTAGAVKG
jgi:ABC-type glycerol-3-phosphate transport system permease component